jgi:hypothetical protein
MLNLARGRIYLSVPGARVSVALDLDGTTLRRGRRDVSVQIGL